MAVFIKLAGDLSPYQKAFFRNLILPIVILTACAVKHEKLVAPKEKIAWKLLFLRCVFGTFGVFGNYYAIDHMVIADASILQKLSPFVLIFLSAVIMKEKCTIWQLIAAAGAFIGAIFIVKPSGNFTNFPALVALFGGVMAGTAYTMVRLLGLHKVNGNFIVVFFSCFSCLCFLPLMILTFKPMSLFQVCMLIATGTCGAAGQFFVTKAYYYAPANQISIYDYFQILFSALLGFLFLGEFPDRTSLIGYVIIISMAVWMYYYNRKGDKQETAVSK